LGKDEQWFYNEDETMVYKQEESGGGAKSPSKPKTGQKRAPTMLKAKNTSIAKDIPPNIATQTDLESVKFGWDSRQFVMTPKFEAGAIIAYSGSSLFKASETALRSNMGKKSFEASKVKHASKYSGFEVLRTEILPVMCEVLECKVDSESVFVRPIYSSTNHRVEVQLSSVEEIDADVNALISSKGDLDHNVEGLLLCAAMMLTGAEPRDDGNVDASIAQEDLPFECTLETESAYNDMRSRQSVYHALRDCAAIVWAKASSANEWAGLEADEMDGSLRHPTRPDERFVPQMAYSEGCLDWMERVYGAECNGSRCIDVKGLCSAAYGEQALAAMAGGIAPVQGAEAAETAAGGESAVAAGDAVSSMVDPSLGGAVAVVFGENGTPQFQMDETGSPVASPARANAGTDNAAEESVAPVSASEKAVAAASAAADSPRPSPRGNTNADVANSVSHAALAGDLDPVLAGFLDGLSDGGDSDGEGSPRSGGLGGLGSDDDDDMEFPSHPNMRGAAAPASPGEAGYAEDFFDDV
jgi:hypothetical protein